MPSSVTRESEKSHAARLDMERDAERSTADGASAASWARAADRLAALETATPDPAAMMPDPREPPETPGDPRHLHKKNGWDWPGWLIAYIVTLVVIRDVILTLLQ